MAPVFERMSSQPDRIGLAVVSTWEAAIEPEERDLLDVVAVTEMLVTVVIVGIGALVIVIARKKAVVEAVQKQL